MLSIILFRLMGLTILYVLIVLSLWDVLGLWTLLFAIVPGVSLVYLLGYPFIVFLSLAGCTFLSFTILEIPLSYFLYNTVFWGIQCITLLFMVASALYKSQHIPMGSLKKQHLLNRLNFSAEEMIVVMNPALHTIEKVSSSIKKLYGWKKEELEGKSLHMIYLHDIFDNPPQGFWQSLHRYHQWCGIVEVMTKDKIICEEIAIYRAIVNEDNEIVLIEKKVLELFVKYKIPYEVNWYEQFYEEIPFPLAVINKSHQIELVNSRFMKEFTTSVISKKTSFSQIFPFSLREKINRALHESFLGMPLNFHEYTSTTAGDTPREFCFSPYFCSKTRDISHVLLTILPLSNKKLTVNIVEKQKNDVEIPSNDNKNISIYTLLKNTITEWYSHHTTTSVKLFTTSFSDFSVPMKEWKRFLISLFSFVENNSSDVSQKMVLSCQVLSFQYFLKISFEGIPYSSKEYVMELMEEVIDNIRQISSMYYFREGNKGELVLTIEFFNVPFNNSKTVE